VSDRPLDGLLPRTEAWVQEELAAQRRVLANLRLQQAALEVSDLPALDRAVAEARELQKLTRERDRRRKMLLKDFQRLWGVSAKSMTLGSICARLGGSGRRLKKLRDELNDVVRDVARTGQRVRTFARYHQGVIREVVETVVKNEGGSVERGGTLLNAEA
jgi:hypothetical protein